jgi:polar amino acid transport system substrate-binding protein
MLNIKAKYYATAIAAILCIGAATESRAKTLTICYDQWPPLTIFPTETSSERGIIIDMLVEIYGSHGFELSFEEVPLARGLSMVNEGLCDLLPEFPGTEDENENFVYGNTPTFTYKTAFVVRTGDEWRYDGVTSLKDKRIATGPGWDYSAMSSGYQSFIDDEANSSRIEIVSGYSDVVDRIFQMIVNERVDLYADSEILLQYILNKTGLNDQLQIVNPGLEEVMIQRPIFSKNIPQAELENIIEIWDVGRNMIKGQREDEILQRYNVELTSEE